MIPTTTTAVDRKKRRAPGTPGQEKKKKPRALRPYNMSGVYDRLTSTQRKNLWQNAGVLELYSLTVAAAKRIAGDLPRERVHTLVLGVNDASEAVDIVCALAPHMHSTVRTLMLYCEDLSDATMCKIARKLPTTVEKLIARELQESSESSKMYNKACALMPNADVE